MKSKEIILAFFIFTIIAVVFFYKTFFQGLIPFPGDLLIAEYNPWKTYSYLEYNPGSFPNKAQYFDVLRQLYPWKTLSIDLLKMGEIPFWNPYNFSGAPLLGNFQSAIFYPFSVLYFVLPQIYAWSLLAILQPLFASIFTFLFARRIGISTIGSLFSAVTYGFSSFMIVWLEYNTIGHVIMWLPLSLLSIEMLLRKITILATILFVLSIVSALLAGHPQVFAYSLLFIIAYLVFRIFAIKKLNIEKVKGLLFFFLLILLGVGAGAIQLIPGIELIKESARVPYDYNFLINKVLIQPWQLIMMLVPDFFGNPATRNYWLDDTYIGKVTYIGIIPLIFVLFSLRHLKKSIIRFLAFSGFIILLLISFNPITIFLYKFNLPIISTSAPTLSVFLFCFCASLLSGFGVDIWRKEKQTLAQVARLASPLVFIIIFLWFIVYLAPQLISDKLQSNIESTYRNLFLATFLICASLFLIFAGSLKKRLIYVVLILLLAFQVSDLFRFFTKFNPFVPSELVFPNAQVLEFLKKESEIDRFWGYGAANIEANFATQHSLFSPNGYDPLYPKKYGEFIQSSADGKIKTEFTRETRSDANINPGFGKTDLSSNIYRLKIMDLLGIRYVLDRVENGSTEKTFPKERFKFIYEKDRWKIYENLKALPRAFLVTDYKVFEDKEEFEKIFFDKDFDPSKVVLLDDPPPRSLFGHLGGGEVATSTPSRWTNRVEVVDYTPNKIVIIAEAESNRLLFLSDTYYPGWKAFVDGKETKIYRANYAFRAIAVPRGKHEIEFVYDPNSFKLGLGISIMSITLLAGFLALFIARSKFITT